jgi:hypothetical protein
VVNYDRPEEGFACIGFDGSRIMLDELPRDRPQRWEVAPTKRPFGRHVNFEITVEALDPLLARFAAEGWPLFLQPETKTYRVGDGSVTVRQFLVQDPDGYLLRFSEAVARTMPRDHIGADGGAPA